MNHLLSRLFAPMLALAAVSALTVTGTAVAAPPADAWEIGPIIKGRSYSPGMPTRADRGRDGASFDIPGPTRREGHVHYVTVPVRSLSGAQRITLRYRIDAPRGTRFLAQEAPGGPGTLSLYFQRAGDRWSPKTPDYRWYSPANRVVTLQPGVHEVSIALDEDWTAMMGPGAHANPRGFTAALARAHRVGFVFGGQSGRGHGVYATQPARFTVLDFEIE